MVVIPYQFRSVSILYRAPCDARLGSRNPLSIQVCFNILGEIDTSNIEISGRNPLSIQVCFNSGTAGQVRQGHKGRNPLSIQVCFNTA